MEFCIRNFICENTQEVAGPMDETAHGKRDKLPVFHVFGVTDTGEKACMHVHGVLPYIVLRVGGAVSSGVLVAMRMKINRLIDMEMNKTRGESFKYQQDYVYRMETFKSKSIYGYHSEDEDFVKVFFSSPWNAQKAMKALGREVVDKPVFQPFEAHLPFHLQFFIDHSIFGMDNIHVKNARFRLSMNDTDDRIIYKNVSVGDIKKRVELMSPYERFSDYGIECDVMATDIENVKNHSKNVHSTNPGLEHIWREEKTRCDRDGIELVDVFNSYEPRKRRIFPQERETLRLARQLARNWRQDRDEMSETIDEALMETRIVHSQENQLDATVWEEPVEEKESSEDLEDPDIDEEDGDEDYDEKSEQIEMTQVIDGKDEQSEEIVNNDVDDDVESGEDYGEENVEHDAKETLQWITGKSAFKQKFVLNGFQFKNEQRTDRSRSQTADTVISIITDETMDEPTITPILSQTTIDENAEEFDEESDIVGLTVASLELLVDTDQPMPDYERDKIVAASVCICQDSCRTSSPCFHKVIGLKPMFIRSSKNEEVLLLDSEQMIIQYVVYLIRSSNADILIGYDTTRCSWGYLIKRAHSMQMSAMIRSMNRFKPEREQEMEFVEAPAGRLLVSVWKCVRADLALRSYDIGTACQNVLRRKIPMLDNVSMMKMLKTCNSSLIDSLIVQLYRLSRLNIALLSEMNWFLRNAEMARVYGIQFHEVWTRGSQLRVESMLLRLCRKLNYVAPSVTAMQRNSMSAPEQLQLILEPQSAVYYDPVIVLDFQSLYPSMVIAHNYCFSTLIGKVSRLEHLTPDANEITLGACQYNVNKEELVRLIAHRNVSATPLASLFVQKGTRHGVLPILLREILSARIMVKNAMKRTKSKKLRKILDARQLALKLVANVTYGYTAANWSGRMPCAELADAILGKGRETLERAIDMVANGDYGTSRVIYGDTDSMFVLVPGASLEEAFRIGRRIAKDVTDANPDPVVLKLEKVYVGCVLETKKRYCGWMYESETDEPVLDAKGIETVRRDTCPLVAECLTKSLELIFKKEWKKLSIYLDRLALSLPTTNVSKFVFCKEFRGDYSKKAMVAQKKIAEKRTTSCRFNAPLRGERLAYVIVDGAPGATVYSCVRSLEEFEANRSVKINTRYYLNSHILAAIRRVTDLLPMKIVVLPMMASNCFTIDCHRLVQSNWCSTCGNSPRQLASAFVQLKRTTQAISEIRSICASCQSCASHRIVDEQISDCRNYSCPIRQAWMMVKREHSKLEMTISAHNMVK